MRDPGSERPRRAAAAALLLRTLRVDARGCREVVARAGADGAAPREVARRLVGRTARRGAVVGFVCALPPHPALRLPAAGIEHVVGLRARVALAARLSYLHDPTFFDRAGWEARVVGGLLTGQRRAPRAAGAARSVARSVGGRVARWTIEQVTRRAAPRALPVVGAVFGGAAGYGDLRAYGEALARERFGALDPVAPLELPLGRLPALYADPLED